jgi:hypothetical protein
MLYEFLIENREQILALSRKKTIGISEDRPTSAKSERGLPKFYDHLIRELKREAKGHPKRAPRTHGPHSVTEHGQELARLGYTVSQVVHGYGGICQAITEYAATTNIPFTASEFSTLNLNLDVAIADAITAFERTGSKIINSPKRAATNQPTHTR